MSANDLPKDITGQVFGRLTALYPTGERRHGKIVWRCRCIDGREVEVSTRDLISGNTKSCGCLSRELKYRHGEGGGHKSSLYTTWASMKTRCLDSNHPSFKRYGARG